MNDIAIIMILKTIIEEAEPYFGMPTKLVDGVETASVPVVQAYQSTQQGVATGPAAYIDVVAYRRIGQPQRVDYIDEETDELVHKEVQKMATMFQLSGLATQDPTSLTQFTAGDIVNRIAMILQNSQTVERLQAESLGIELGRDTRNPKFLDDRMRFEASPSLDFTITHDLIVTREQPVLQSQELNIIVI